MRILYLLVLISIIGCQGQQSQSKSTQKTATQPDVEKKITKQAEQLPQNVIDFLKNNFTDWAIPDTSDYMKAWWSFYDPDQLPYFAKTDLNDDKADDYAIILKKDSTLRLVILLSSGNLFKSWIANDFKETYTDKEMHLGLRIEPAGQSNHYVNGDDVTLFMKSQGIALMDLEMKLKIYYWENGDIKLFKTR